MEVRFTSQVLKNSNNGNVALTSLQLFISRTQQFQLAKQNVAAMSKILRQP